MRLNQNPVFRKIIVPWYDSNTACYLLIAFMILVIFFGMAGISVCCETPEYQKHVWVPLVLVLPSGGVLVSTSIRMIKRRFR